jgi:Ycf66 protein N-terminus
MLNHLLAGIVGFGGLSLFLSGFFFPEVRRKPDFAWSGVALLYALVLWLEGDNTSGGALLGHIASVTLIVWFGWQTLQQRQQFAASEERTSIPGSLETLTPFLKAGWARMTAAYGETADWLQTQLGKGEASVPPESLRSQSPQGDDLEDAWNENISAVSTSSPASVVAAETPEHPEPELSASRESETQVETPQAADLQQNPAQPPEGLEDTSPLAAPDLPEGKENSSPSPDTDSSAASKTEISHNSLGEEAVTESPSAPLEAAQDISNEEPMHEDASHNPAPEYDDGSWPPEDPVT